jgi:hypothetical protein
MQWSSRPGLARHCREAGLRGNCVQCTRKAINSIVKTIEGFASWTRSYKVFTKILYDRLLPYANAAVHYYQAGVQSGKSTTDQLFALRQILEKCNEFNITTHHLFIDFKVAYDTIIRNEVYVGMSELNFSTKLIRLTKETLIIVTCCVKSQNDYSKSFETRQGLRETYYLRCSSYDEQTYKQPAQSKQRNTTTRICRWYRYRR